jgi:hypothetical protein
MFKFFSSIFNYIDGTKRLKALFDKSALLLIVPATLVLLLLDPALAKTLIQWGAFGIPLAGIAVIISRIIFPQVHLNELVESAYHERNVAAANIVLGLLLFVGLLILALAIWAAK